MLKAISQQEKMHFGIGFSYDLHRRWEGGIRPVRFPKPDRSSFQMNWKEF